MKIDSQNFRKALSQYPTGVCIITCHDERDNHNGHNQPAKQPIGVTASSFNSVSLDPPLILWSIAKSAYSAPIFQRASHFAVNVLTSQQSSLANQFASRGQDKFAGVAIQTGIADLPLIANSAACFQCKTWQIYEGGDHYIMVGEVVEFEFQDSAQALVFHQGHYATPETQISPAMSEKISSFLDNYLLYQLRQAYSHYSQGFYTLLRKQFAVNAETWRVLSALYNEEAMPLKMLSEVVGQPMEDLQLTLDTIIGERFIEREGDKVKSTAQGKKLAHEMLTLAKSYEDNVLNRTNLQSEYLLQALNAIRHCD